MIGKLYLDPETGQVTSESEAGTVAVQQPLTVRSVPSEPLTEYTTVKVSEWNALKAELLALRAALRRMAGSGGD